MFSQIPLTLPYKNKYKHVKTDSRSLTLTVRYKFNTINSKYKGTGAGNNEKSRL